MMDKIKETIQAFFQVVIQKQTYLNLAYLLLSFPLGTAYFIFLVTGIAAGISLLFVWIGFLVLLAMLAAWWMLLVFERRLAIWLLKVPIEPLNRKGLKVKGLKQLFVAYITNPVTWKGLLYLLLKFPVGILNFVLTAAGLAISGSFLAAPFIYRGVPLQIWVSWQRSLTITNLPTAVVISLMGAVMLISTLHLVNGLAWINAQVTRLLLGNTQEPIPGPLPPDPGWPKYEPAPPAQNDAP
jgi:hypothetical protein